MSETYKGGSVPPDLPVRVRKLLEDHDRALTRGVAKETVIVNLIGGGRNPGGGSQPAVAFQVSNVTGTVNRIPPQAAGTIVAFRFPNLPLIKDQTGNIILASGDMQILSKDEILVLSSDGTNWYEISRSRSGATSSVFVPVALWDATPSITANNTTKIQAAFDNCPSGCTLVFEPGTYICNGANLTRNDLTLYLTGGTIITSNTATTKATINVAGTVDTGAGTSLVQSPGVFDVTYPRAGDRTIYVAAGAETGFPADSWIWIEDDEVPANGLPADPELEQQYHGELVRVKSTASGVLNLYSPLINTYVRVGATDPRIRTVTPVQNFKIFGEGMIQNPQAGANIAHGLRLFHTVGATVEDVTFDRCWDSGVQAIRSTEVKVNGAHFQNAVRFDSRGYGFVSMSSSRVTVSGSSFKRLRHCIDFSTFSRLCTATGNNCIGSTTGNINTHPSVVGVTISGNTIDGGHGQDATVTSTEYGDSTIQASGINIDQGNKDISITGNIIMNMRFSGILVDFGGPLATPANWTEYVTIDGNIIENCQLYRRVSGAPAMANHAGIALLETQAGGTARRGIVCSNNILRDPGQYGIRVGVDNALVQGNWVDAAADKRPTSLAVVIGVGIWATPSTATVPSGIILRNNVVSNCAQDGLRVTTDNTTVEGNRSVSNGRRGLFVESTSVATIVRHNYLEGNGEDGINFPASGGFIIGNRGTNNTGFDLRMIAGANNNLVKDNLFSSTNTISNAGASNFIVWHDLINDRIGIGTSTPDRMLDLEDSTNPALRLTHTSGTRFTDLQHTTVNTWGGLSLQPATNAETFKNIALFGTSESTGLMLFDDNSSFWLRTSMSRSLDLNAPSGFEVRANVNFGQQLIVQETQVATTVPLAAAVSGATDTAHRSVGVTATRTGGLPAAGFGGYLGFTLEADDGSDPGPFIEASQWQAVWSNPNSATPDSDVRFLVRDAGTLKETVRFAGALPGVRIENVVGGAPNALLDVRGDAIFNEDGANADFRIESDQDANCFSLDANAVDTDALTGVGGIGIGIAVPTAKLHIRHTSGDYAFLIENSSGVDKFAVSTGTSSSTSVGTDVLIPLTDNTTKLGDFSNALGWKEVYSSGPVYGTRFLALSDPGSGTTGYMTFCDAIAAVSGATPATIGNTGGGPAAAAQSHWLKIYDGTTARYIPVWT